MTSSPATPTPAEVSMDVLTALLSTSTADSAVQTHPNAALASAPPTHSPVTAPGITPASTRAVVTEDAVEGATVHDQHQAASSAPPRSWLQNFASAVTTRLSLLRTTAPHNSADPNDTATPTAVPPQAPPATPAAQIASVASAVVNRATVRALTFLTRPTKEVHFLTASERDTLAHYRHATTTVRHVSPQALLELARLSAPLESSV